MSCVTIDIHFPSKWRSELRNDKLADTTCKAWTGAEVTRTCPGTFEKLDFTRAVLDSSASKA